MKAIRNLTVFFTLFMLGAALLFFSVSRKYTYTKRDIVFYNDQLYKAEEDFLQGMPEEGLEARYGCYIIMSKELDDPELAELYSAYAFVLDFAPGGEYIGKIAWKDEFNRFERTKADFLKASMILWGIVLGGGYMLLFLIWLLYARPLHQLENFSREIAKGNLDIRLPRHRVNIFGSFTEAFDIMREELKTARAREIEAEIARKELVASLSHDIKTPLSVIKATTEVLDLKLEGMKEVQTAEETDKRAKDALELTAVIASKADTIGSLMTEMMHANMEELELIEVRAEEENSTEIEEFIRKLDGYGRITIEDHIPPCLVLMDRLRMEQVIDNVIGNSHKYAGTEIKVSFEQMNNILMADGKEGSFICIRISDSGPGVSEDDLPLIAEKYYRGSNARENNGFGLGLYLVKIYMNRMGGGMEYYNDNGFTVELMVKKV